MRYELCLFAAVAALAAGCRSSGDGDTSLGVAAQAVAGSDSDTQLPTVDDARLIIGDESGARVVPAPAAIRSTLPLGAVKEKPPVVQPADPIPQQPEKQLVLQMAAQKAASEVMPVTFVLHDVPADWKAFRETKLDVDRNAFIQSRLATLMPTRQGFLNWLSANGATDIRALWLANIVHARLPAGKISTAVSQPAVVDVARSGVAVGDDGLWTGKESTDAVRISNLYAAGIKGRPGGRTRPRVQIALIELSVPYRGHAGWNTTAGFTRMRIVRDCRSGTACPLSGATATTSTHATSTGAIAAASIENGQDPAFPGAGTVDQREHSGHLASSYIHYYQFDSDDDVPLAIQEAVMDGADVINMSFFLGTPADGCNRFTNFSGVNQALENAVNAGVVIVKSAGNDGGTACSLSYPATRPHTLAINGVDTATTTQTYNTVPILTSASRGGLTIRSHSGALATASRVDGVVPGKLTGLLSPPGNSYTGGLSGSSAAAPVAAGIVGEIRSAFATIGWPNADARYMMVNTLLMGDGWDSDSSVQTVSGMSSRSGAGRLKTHWPSSTDLVGSWGWGMRAVTFTSNNQQISWPVGSGGPMPAGITQWKWAVLWTPTNLDDVPDVDFFVDDVCAGGGVLALDTGYDVRARFRLGQSTISGRCLQMRAVAYSVPSTGVTIYSADYFHSGGTGDH